MKKVLTMVLALSMVFALSCPTAFAMCEKEVTLFETDFENETVGAGPKSVQGYGAVDAASNNNAIVYQGESGSGNETKYIDTKDAGSNKRFRMWFNEPVSTGTIIAEFDINPGVGNVAFGLVYNDSPNTYQKWPVYISNTGVFGYLKSDSSHNPPVALDDTATFTKTADRTPMTFKKNTWQHFMIKIDLTNKSVAVYIDGVESIPVTGYKYFDSAIGGIAFYCNKGAGASSMFDNIKVYKEDNYGTYSIEKNFEDGKDGTAAKDGVKVSIRNDYEKVNNFNRTKVLDFTGKVNSIARYELPQSVGSGKIYVEFDARVGYGGMAMAAFNSGDNYGNFGQAVFSSGTGNSTPKYGLKAYIDKDGAKKHPGGNAYVDGTTNNANFTYIKGYRAPGAASDMALTINTWQHVKMELDIDNNRAKCTLDGVESNYVEGFNYFKAIKYISFKWSPQVEIPKLAAAQKEAYIDNVKVYATSDGKSVTNLISGAKAAKLTFKDTVDVNTLNNIKLFAQDGTAVESTATLSVDKKTVTLASDGLADGSKYFILLNGVKYTDGNAVCETRKEFIYQTGSFSIAIDEYTPKYAKGDTVSVDYTVNATDFSKDSVELIVAAYKDGSLTDVQLLTLPCGTQSITGTKTVELTLTKDCDTVSAFAWEGGSLVPCCANLPKTNK